MPSSSLISLGRCAQGANLGIVVMDSDAQHLWRSFDFASRHAFNLPLQLMTRDTKLVSALARGYSRPKCYQQWQSVDLLDGIAPEWALNVSISGKVAEGGVGV